MDAEWYLEQWSIWKRSGDDRLGYPNSTPYERMRGSSGPTAQIDDIDGCMVDRFVTDLRQSFPREGEAVRLRYLYNSKQEDIGKSLRCSRRLAAELTRAGVMYVQGRLSVGGSVRPS